MNSHVIEEGFQRVWQLLERYAQDAERRSQESDRKSQETKELMERQSQETDRKFQETKDLIERQSLEAAQRAQEAERRFQETERIVQETSRKIGRLGNRLGEFVEELIEPSVVNLFQQRGIDVHKVSSRVIAKNKQLGLSIEIDLLVVNVNTCILIEIKSRLVVPVIDKHIERIAKFKLLFPEYADKQVLGAVAGMVITEDAMEYAYQQGFFVIGQRGDTAVILNDAQFKPKAW